MLCEGSIVIPNATNSLVRVGRRAQLAQASQEQMPLEGSRMDLATLAHLVDSEGLDQLHSQIPS